MKYSIIFLLLVCNLYSAGQPSSSINLSFKFFTLDGKQLNKEIVCSEYVKRGRMDSYERTYFELCIGEHSGNTYNEKTGWFHFRTSSIYPPFEVTFIHNGDTMKLILELNSYRTPFTRYAIDSLIFAKGEYNLSLKFNLKSYSNDTAYLSFIDVRINNVTLVHSNNFNPLA
jgi:hypothetical protein